MVIGSPIPVVITYLERPVSSNPGDVYVTIDFLFGLIPPVVNCFFLARALGLITPKQDRS